MRSTMHDVQVAVFAILNGDATLKAMLDPNGIVDSIAEGSGKKRYVAFGESDETPEDTLDDTGGGRNEVFSVHCVAEDTQDAGGWKTCKQIAARVVELLDGAELSIPGAAVIYCHFERSSTDHDPPWRQAITDFRVATEEL